MYSMRKIWKARSMILEHVPAKEVSDKLGIPLGTLYKYTKAERDKVKKEKLNGIYK